VIERKVLHRVNVDKHLECLTLFNIVQSSEVQLGIKARVTI
jgi:hypothetical protein